MADLADDTANTEVNDEGVTTPVQGVLAPAPVPAPVPDEHDQVMMMMIDRYKIIILFTVQINYMATIWILWYAVMLLLLGS